MAKKDDVNVYELTGAERAKVDPSYAKVREAAIEQYMKDAGGSRSGAEDYVSYVESTFGTIDKDEFIDDWNDDTDDEVEDAE